MTKLILIAALLSATFAIDTERPQRNGDLATVKVCHITMQIPNNLKRNDREGIDSCVAEFENRDMLLSIDYGWYGGAATKSDGIIDFKEQAFLIGGKRGRLATYIDDSLYARKHPERKYVAHLYVELHPRSTVSEMTMSLTMTVSGRSAKELEVGVRIFRSVRFDWRATK
jgi:hypothetical protein